MFLVLIPFPSFSSFRLPLSSSSGLPPSASYSRTMPSSCSSGMEKWPEDAGSFLYSDPLIFRTDPCITWHSHQFMPVSHLSDRRALSSQRLLTRQCPALQVSFPPAALDLLSLSLFSSLSLSLSCSPVLCQLLELSKGKW